MLETLTCVPASIHWKSNSTHRDYRIKSTKLPGGSLYDATKPEVNYM